MLYVLCGKITPYDKNETRIYITAVKMVVKAKEGVWEMECK